MPKILIVHPEGNIKNNPNLFAITRMMVEDGWEVLVYSRRRPGVYQGDIFPGARFVFFEDTVRETIRLERSFADEDIRFVIGIDDFGIYKAKEIASFLGVKYLFLSYEILFDEEIKRIGCRIDRINKRRAKAAVRYAECAIVQDETRKQILSREYGIPQERIYLMPVANSCSHKVERTHYFYDKFAIPYEKKILLYMGWMDKNQEQRMVEFAKYLPDDWVLVAHSRYRYQATIDSDWLGKKLFFSGDAPVESMDEMGILLSSCSMGFCSYEPDYSSIYTGDNIKYIGLSSGKTTTFLQYGVPVIVENMNIWDELVEPKKMGLVMHQPEDLQKLSTINPQEYADNAIRFFDEHLDAKIYWEKIWKEVEKNAIKSRLGKCVFLQYKLHLFYETCIESMRIYLKGVRDKYFKRGK